MICTSLLLASLLQDPQGIAAVQADQDRRVTVIAEAARAVCSVMKMDSAGGGSGVIIDPLGLVLTNYHVVGEPVDPNKKKPGWDFGLPGGGDEEREESDEKKTPDKPYYPTMKIGLPDGRLYKAEVLGIDPGSDLAILYLGERDDGKPWPYRPLGDSDALLVGETVFAMGNPFLLATDFSPTVTFGIVSGTHRYQSGQGNRMLVYPDCIQVDAPVNPGNSGGPLFNEMGEVVGINGRITLRDRGRVNTGVGFAIASNQIRNFLGDLMAGRHTEHGTLDLNAYFMNSPAENRRGVFVQAIFEDSKARDLGVDIGDELLTFNGRRIRSANQLATLVGVLPFKAWVTLGYRKALGEGGYGEKRVIYLRLSRLDTGSSVREDWIASDEVRTKARQTLAARFGSWGQARDHGTVELESPEGKKTILRRRGERLLIETQTGSLVLTGAGEGFRSTGSRQVDLELEERALLERNLRVNPFLYGGDELIALLEGTLLHGGVFVHGRPAFAFEVPGDIEQRIYFYEDGTPAGYMFRDPVRKALFEVRVPHPEVIAKAKEAIARGEEAEVPAVRVVLDEESLVPGYLLRVVDGPAPDDRLFSRSDR